MNVDGAVSATGVAEATDATSRVAALVVIEPRSGWIALRLDELWTYRDLLYFLTWRDIKVRYKQTELGAAWAILQPLLTMVVFSVFFGRLAKMPADGVPYPIFSIAGILPWQLFAYSLSQSGNSIVASRALVTKVYFPRLVIPVASVLAGLVDFAVASVLMIGMMLWYHVTPGPRILALPLFVLLAVASAMAAGLWLSVLNVRYRDVQYTIPFLTQFWMFVTPIAYPASLVPERWRVLYGLNPMVGVVEGFRWALLGTGNPVSPMVIVSVGIVIVALVGGVAYFRRFENRFADIV